MRGTLASRTTRPISSTMDMATATYKDEEETKDAWETLTTVIGNISMKLDIALQEK
jgi:hypothetical protein